MTQSTMTREDILRQSELPNIRKVARTIAQCKHRQEVKAALSILLSAYMPAKQQNERNAHESE